MSDVSPTGTKLGVITGQHTMRIRVPCDAIAPFSLAGSPSTGYLVTCQRERGHDGEHRILVKWDGAVTRIALTDAPDPDATRG